MAELAETNATAAEDMDLETLAATPAQKPDDACTESEPANVEANSKRAREEEESDGVAKKTKVEEKSAEEKRLEKLGEGDKGSGRVSLGPKSFASAVEMFDYFYKLLHYWPADLNINKYEYLVLLDLLKKGHAEPDKKIGGGIQAFQVRFHPLYRSRCYFLIREDGASDDFSFRKCVDHILPLPENMKANSDANKALGGGKGSGRGGWRGRGRGRSRN